jgi:1-deoxy-D-xylulose-5-phosphate reductoisomerase
MPSNPTNVAILGSTGSIGRNALEVVAASNGALRAVALSAHQDLGTLVEQARQFTPQWVVASKPAAAAEQSWTDLPPGCQVAVGPAGLEQVVRTEAIDVVVAAIVGSAGLRSTWAALDAGKRVALANKETLVMAGPLVTRLAADRGGQIIPVDSEHSAVFQALQSGRRQDLKRVILTASGGPFRGYSSQQLSGVTVADALNHPTWRMGPKITVDSATMMNKALEIIEARWLFDLQPDQIDVVVHPQSIVHSMVEFVDGSVVAQMSPPDMKLPIQYALTYPKRTPGIAAKLDLTQPLQLDFEPPDYDRFPALQLGIEVARDGGTSGAVLNAANEAAVASFLSGELPFVEIVPACRSVLEHHHFESHPSLERLFELDAWAREEVGRWVCTL